MPCPATSPASPSSSAARRSAARSRANPTEDAAMGLPRLVAYALAAVAPALSAAQVFTVSPANPSPLDTVTVRKPYDNEDATLTRLSMSRNRITVKLQFAGAGFPEPPPVILVQALGKLPAGAYQVEIVYVDAGG